MPVPGGEIRIGVDVGGTFTDVFWLDEATGTCRVAKVPSTPADQSAGFIKGIRTGSQTGRIRDLSTVVHGTTIGTNALLQRKGARTGLITTEGFRDVLEMRRRDRPEIWGLRGSYTPIVKREHRLVVRERTLADGTVRTQVDPEAVKFAATRLREAGAQSLAIMFINSYANPANEEAALEAASSVWPDGHITISSRILPELREFERVSTTVLNSTLQPVMSDYLERLETVLKEDDFGGDVLIVQSNGGVMDIQTASEVPVRTALSGPAAGVIAGAHIAGTSGFPNVITCDMGGTSFDVALVAGGVTEFTPQASIDFGLVIRTPMIRITTIGAGGGSIAHVDRSGILQVGPQSAGAEPGPACHGLGGELPTVTDANVLLGRINADRPIGEKRLDINAAREAISRHVAIPLELDETTAAEAIIRVANSRMAGAIRLVSIERGHDPRKFTAMPFGGGGALHAGALVREVGLGGALVPRFPGVTSALGCVLADMRHDFVQTINSPLHGLDTQSLLTRIRKLSDEGESRLRGAGVSLIGIQMEAELDMQYVGQTHTVGVPLGAEDTTEDDISRSFSRSYNREYGRTLEGLPVHVMNLRVSVIGSRPDLDLTALAPPESASMQAARREDRAVYLDGAWQQTRIFDRLALPVGAVIEGPAILEQPDSTTLVDPGLAGRVDRFGNVVIERQAGSSEPGPSTLSHTIRVAGAHQSQT